MAYPAVSAPYGLKPINLIGGQVFSGSTRNYPIQYGYNTNIFYGDFVGLALGVTNRIVVTTGASTSTGGAGSGMVGIFLGCTYTNPLTKQKQFSQYWPAGTLAGDAQAIVTDDPDTVFKSTAVAASGNTTITSFNTGYLGQNLQASNLAGNVNTGNSSNAVLAGTAVSASNTGYPIRVLSLVPDTAVSTTGTNSGSAVSGTTITLASAITSFPSGYTSLPVGTEVGYLASNGQYVYSGAFVASAYTSGTSVTINVAPGGSISNIPANATLVFTCYPEALVKINFGNHAYYSNAPL